MCEAYLNTLGTLDLQCSFSTDRCLGAEALYANSVDCTECVRVDGLRDVAHFYSWQPVEAQQACELAAGCVHQLPLPTQLVYRLQ